MKWYYTWLRLPKLCWIKVVRVKTLVLFLILKGNAFGFPPLRIYSHIENVGWSYMDFIMLRYFYSVTTFWRVFIINGCWILSNAFFSHLLRWSWGLKSLLMWYCHVDLCILKNPCITGINPTCSWCMMLLMCCWSWFANILMKIFTSMSISDIGP